MESTWILGAICCILEAGKMDELYLRVEIIQLPLEG